MLFKEGASCIKDSMIIELNDINSALMLSIDITPVPTKAAVGEIKEKESAPAN